MQSFYISNNKNLLDLKIFNKYLKKENLSHDFFNLNFFYSNNNNSIVTQNNLTYISLGVLIYKNKFNKEGLKLLVNDISKEYILESILSSEDIRGQFAIIIINKNNIKVITDKLGYYGLYFYKNQNQIAFSNSILSLGKNNKTSFTLSVCLSSVVLIKSS